MGRLATLTAVATLALAGVVLAGCGGSGLDTTSAETAASTPFDQAFIDAMVPHHQAAIEMAKTAKDAGLSQPELVAIADAVIETQQAEIDQMLAWREDWFGSVEIDPSRADALGLSMEGMGMAGDPAELESAEDVDAMFASMMIAHHEGAIAMARMARERAQHVEIRSLAEAIVEAQQAEIGVMREHASAEHHM